MKKNIKRILIFSLIAAFAFASSGCFTTMAIIARTAEAASETTSTFEFSFDNKDWKDPFDIDDTDGTTYDFSDPDDLEDAIESFMSEFSSALEDDYNNNKDDDEDDSDDFRTDAGRS